MARRGLGIPRGATPCTQDGQGATTRELHVRAETSIIRQDLSGADVHASHASRTKLAAAITVTTVVSVMLLTLIVWYACRRRRRSGNRPGFGLKLAHDESVPELPLGNEAQEMEQPPTLAELSADPTPLLWRSDRDASRPWGGGGERMVVSLPGETGGVQSTTRDEAVDSPPTSKVGAEPALAAAATEETRAIEKRDARAISQIRTSRLAGNDTQGWLEALEQRDRDLEARMKALEEREARVKTLEDQYPPY
jgi:hypothetical protein